jgi:hypothetical protein
VGRVPAYGHRRGHTPTIAWCACSNLAKKRKQACNPPHGREGKLWRGDFSGDGALT